MISVLQEPTPLALQDANCVSAVKKALVVVSVMRIRDSVHVCQAHSVSAVMAARPGTGASLTAGRASAMVMQKSVTKGLVPALTAGVTQQETSVKSVPVDSMVIQSWAQETSVVLALVQKDPTVGIILLPPVIKTTTTDRWSATVNRATQVCAVKNVLLVIMVIPLSLVAGASPAAVATILTCQIRRRVTGGLDSVANVYTTQRGLTAACARAATTGMALGATAGSAPATSWVQSAVSVYPERNACVSVPQDSVSVYPMSLDSPVITVPQITGTWPVDEAANPAAVTPIMPTHPPAMSSPVSASVVTALVEGRVGTAKRTFGEIPERCAEPVTVTVGALRPLSVTV